MNRTLIIFAHELTTTLRRVGFIVMTLALPVLALLIIGLSSAITNIARPPEATITNIGYVDEQGIFSNFTTQGNVRLKHFDNSNDALKAMAAGQVKEYYVIPSDYSSTGHLARFTLTKEPNPQPEIISAMKNFLTSNILTGKVPDSSIPVIESPLNPVTTRLTPEGEKAAEQGGLGNLIVPGIFGLLLVLSLTFSSAYLIQGLGEEKESRLIEILLSSVSARQLLTGKVLGLGAAGLVQVIVWLVSLPLLMSLAGIAIGGFFSAIQIPIGFIFLGIIYFILGYSLFAVISIFIAAISPSAREGQQVASIFTLLSVSPLWFSGAIIALPNSPAWVVLTIFPLTAPVVVMLRLGLTDIPIWQLATSMIIMAGCIVGLLMASVRLLRKYLLSSAKLPSLRQLIKGIRTR